MNNPTKNFGNYATKGFKQPIEMVEKRRQSRLEELGWNVVRFSDSDIKSDLMGCANRVRTWLPVV